jgi:hypothetical protein
MLQTGELGDTQEMIHIGKLSNKLQDSQQQLDNKMSKIVQP